MRSLRAFAADMARAWWTHRARVHGRYLRGCIDDAAGDLFDVDIHAALDLANEDRALDPAIGEQVRRGMRQAVWSELVLDAANEAEHHGTARDFLLWKAECQRAES